MEPSSSASPSNASCLSRHQFLVYRLFSLAGVVPVGAFLCVHLAVNATVLESPEAFQAQVDRIHAMELILPLVEWAFIFLPLLFHGIVGVMLITGSIPNPGLYKYTSNIRYTLQRVTGFVAFLFILVHVLHMHQLGSPLEWLGGNSFDPHHAASSSAEALQGSLLVQVFYVTGVLACVYHLSNGLWTFGITWGIWITPAAQRRASAVATAFGVGLASVGIAAMIGMLNIDVDEARIKEDRMHQQRPIVTGEEPSEASVTKAESETKK